MTLNDFIKILLGNQFNQFDFLEKANVDEFSKEITICLERRIGVPYTCIHCGQQCLFAFDRLPERRVEDIPLGEYRLFWKFTPKRIKCPYCNQVHIEKIDGLTPHSRQTDRFRLHIARRCNDSSVSAVARQYGLNDDTVRKIDKEFLSKREKITPPEICEKLGIDEIAIRKGHVYATVFYNHDTRSVIHMVQGRATTVVCDFFKEKGVEWCYYTIIYSNLHSEYMKPKQKIKYQKKGNVIISASYPSLPLISIKNAYTLEQKWIPAGVVTYKRISIQVLDSNLKTWKIADLDISNLPDLSPQKLIK